MESPTVRIWANRLLPFPSRKDEGNHPSQLFDAQ
jgi:hypothetical protein